MQALDITVQRQLTTSVCTWQGHDTSLASVYMMAMMVIAMLMMNAKVSVVGAGLLSGRRAPLALVHKSSLASMYTRMIMMKNAEA